MEVSGGVFEVHTAVTDITERKRPRRRYGRARNAIRCLFDEAPGRIYILADTETGIIVDCNQALAGFSGQRAGGAYRTITDDFT